ncbi:NAD(P)/FAD-dependent oxidoreductase [Ancylothrix sp. C2]|uniref:NAD(P)/FAD-dependent oxidoreductase n=1 Tax=Ancylothrix sp. D3o TaxID=2953691 RepID=UPI0021BB0182|nr:NAD(P)/FAD-dependent oxidoreductase [Ancylothrix sp. D3o]MCT7950174.1 NAD(P)/FAD-dependent oxidoreductase [Ancylothrix sp. D3o]
MNSDSLNIIIIGGGAAGFFGAVSAAETNPHCRVTILEAAREPLGKVRISGGGRCNVTHSCFDAGSLVQNYPRGGKALRGAFTRFQARDTVNWFERKGVKLKTEEDGRMFPITDNSNTIVYCLLNAAEDAGVKIYTGTSVASISALSPGFEINLKAGKTLKTDRLLLATGSNPSGYKWAQELGHTIEKPVPSLFTFNIKDERLQDLAGVSVANATVRLTDAKLEQTGPVLITHWGLSGPAVLKLSAWGARFLHDSAYKTTITINWLPQYKQEKLREMLLAVKSQLPQRMVSSSCPLPIPRRLWEKLTVAAEIDENKRWAEVSNKSLNLLIQELTGGKYQVTGKGVFKEEFVTCGGVNLKEIDFKTMESKIQPGLYFAGEILDIDGITGGFNFQSAWTTGWLAGKAISQ